MNRFSLHVLCMQNGCASSLALESTNPPIFLSAFPDPSFRISDGSTLMFVTLGISLLFFISGAYVLSRWRSMVTETRIATNYDSYVAATGVLTEACSAARRRRQQYHAAQEQSRAASTGVSMYSHSYRYSAVPASAAGPGLTITVNSDVKAQKRGLIFMLAAAP